MTPTITDAEWEIMRIIWADSPLTSRQIIDRALRILGWKEGTVKSLLSRLTAKGALYKDTHHSPYLFSATLTQYNATCIALDQILATTCQKDCHNYLNYLIQNHALSQTDCAQLIHALQVKSSHAPVTIACNCPDGQCSCHHSKGTSS